MNETATRLPPELLDSVKKFWGYETLLPLQAEAMACALEGRDSVVILPTGGGKSLCFQAPAVARPGVALVVSPLLSLMKDQVDALAECGVAAARLDGSMSSFERDRVVTRLLGGELKLLYLAPERLMNEGFLGLLGAAELAFVAIDEAHCISAWGHDFRPEYRQLGQLKKTLSGVAVHAYTATATERVRGDIVDQLGLIDPAVLVGSFDRPNLVYRVERRGDLVRQVREAIDRHRGESGIVYCIRRADVDAMCDDLNRAGARAIPYHAGMDSADRKRNQEAFSREEGAVVVATVAFGMGIDKSNVRFVVHAGMPKSLEHYQQECGRAGRDGLEAECSLFFSGGDYGKWQFILSKGEPEVVGVAMKKLKEMADYCGAGVCRRRAILNYFGEEYAREKCDACDVCLGDMEWLEDPLPEAQKILSCIVRLDQRFGGDYTADVLVGAETPRVAERGHDRLSTYGLLKSFGKRVARDWIEQLVAQGFARKVGEYQTLEVTPLGWRAIKAEKTPRLLRPAEKKRRAARSAPIEASWEGVDAGLFEELRVLRRRLAEEKSLPAFVIFSDAALRDMARLRPTKLESFLQARGVGERKTESYGKLFVHVIREYCELKRIATDLAAESSDLDGAPSRMPPAKARAFEMFRQGATIDEAAAALGRARSTTAQYLIDFIAAEGVVDPAPWAEEATLRRVAQAREEAEDDRLKPIFEALGGEIGYDVIRACVGCLKNRERAAAG